MVPRATRRLTPLTATNPANSFVISSVSRMVSALINATFPWPGYYLLFRGRRRSRQPSGSEWYNRYHRPAVVTRTTQRLSTKGLGGGGRAPCRFRAPVAGARPLFIKHQN